MDINEAIEVPYPREYITNPHPAARYTDAPTTAAHTDTTFQDSDECFSLSGKIDGLSLGETAYYSRSGKNSFGYDPYFGGMSNIPSPPMPLSPNFTKTQPIRKGHFPHHAHTRSDNFVF